jgi:hypothetical protein
MGQWAYHVCFLPPHPGRQRFNTNILAGIFRNNQAKIDQTKLLAQIYPKITLSAQIICRKDPSILVDWNSMQDAAHAALLTIPERSGFLHGAVIHHLSYPAALAMAASACSNIARLTALRRRAGLRNRPPTVQSGQKIGRCSDQAGGGTSAGLAAIALPESTHACNFIVPVIDEHVLATPSPANQMRCAQMISRGGNTRHGRGVCLPSFIALPSLRWMARNFPPPAEAAPQVRLRENFNRYDGSFENFEAAYPKIAESDWEAAGAITALRAESGRSDFAEGICSAVWRCWLRARFWPARFSMAYHFFVAQLGFR